MSLFKPVPIATAWAFPCGRLSVQNRNEFFKQPVENALAIFVNLLDCLCEILPNLQGIRQIMQVYSVALYPLR